MVSERQCLCVLIVVSLIISFSLTVSPEGETKKITLRQDTKIYLAKAGRVGYELKTSVDAGKLITEDQWVKVQLTGWVRKSEVPELVSGEEKSDEIGAKDIGQKEGEPITSGTAGPFKIRIQSVHFQDKAKDRFGSEYKSGEKSSFLVLDLTVVNTHGEKKRNIYKTNISLLDHKGRQYKSVGISTENTFSGGSLEPGEERQGYLFFAVFNDSDLKSIQIKGRACSSCSKYKKLFTLGEIMPDRTES